MTQDEYGQLQQYLTRMKEQQIIIKYKFEVEMIQQERTFEEQYQTCIALQEPGEEEEKVCYEYTRNDGCVTGGHI